MQRRVQPLQGRPFFVLPILGNCKITYILDDTPGASRGGLMHWNHVDLPVGDVAAEP